MPAKRQNKRFPFSVVLLTLACLVTIVSSSANVDAQTTPDSVGPCTQSPFLYQLANYTVKHITVRPMVRFIPGGSLLQESLNAAISSQAPGSTGLFENQKFDTVGVSFLESQINAELESRALRGQMGLIFAHHRLINCDETARTLDVQYEVLTVARPSYLRNAFELRDQREKNKEAAGDLEDKKQYSVLPFAGYNRSRAIFGGADASFESDFQPVSKVTASASGSGSSAEVDVDFVGSKNFDSGLLNYAEWRAAYHYSNIPTDGFELKEGTAAARLFVATHPLLSRNLILRLGGSMEGGNRQSSLPQFAAPPSTLVDSGYGSLKVYIGASLTSRRQDWKASYGLQLGNTGEGFSINYRKQIVDAAYRLRFFPVPFKPFQLDVQFNAGSLTTTSGTVPYGERFFGGNAEQEFIQGDSWKIRAGPVIRSFPQNRLSGTGGLIPTGGDNFLSINFTAAQTIWQKKLIPAEISEDPDVNTGLGTQLLTARVFFREEAVKRSKQMMTLQTQVGCNDEKSPNHCLTPTINRLKALLAQLLAQAGSNEELKNSINSFSDDDGSNPIGDVEDAISSAKLDPEAAQKPVEDPAQLQGNPVEGNVTRLIKDDFGDPNDSDDDFPSLLTIVQKHITNLQEHLSTQPPKTELQAISAAIDDARKTLKEGLIAVNSLRAYSADDLKGAKAALNQPAASGRTLDQVLADIRALLKPERDSVREQIKQLNLQLSQSSDTDPRTIELKRKREAALNQSELLDAADTYAEAAASAYGSAQKLFESKDFEGVKIYVERLAVGFGGLLAYLSGLELKANELEKLQPPPPIKLKVDIGEVRLIQRRLRSAYQKISVPAAEAKANQTVDYVGRVLGVFFRETNLIAVSPVFMFDAARLRVTGLPGTDRFRYGIGSGIRFSLINVDFTAGYSFNPTRRLDEPRGAFVFRMDINDLFK